MRTCVSDPREDRYIETFDRNGEELCEGHYVQVIHSDFPLECGDIGRIVNVEEPNENHEAVVGISVTKQYDGKWVTSTEYTTSLNVARLHSNPANYGMGRVWQVAK